jgi:hypothetical protein
MLTNRPLPCSVVILENEGALRTIQRNETYTCTEPFVADMLTLHENGFLSNPNAAYGEGDCRGQMATKALLRMLSSSGNAVTDPSISSLPTSMQVISLSTNSGTLLV